MLSAQKTSIASLSNEVGVVGLFVFELVLVSGVGGLLLEDIGSITVGSVS